LLLVIITYNWYGSGVTRCGTVRLIVRPRHLALFFTGQFVYSTVNCKST